MKNVVLKYWENSVKVLTEAQTDTLAILDFYLKCERKRRNKYQGWANIYYKPVGDELKVCVVYYERDTDKLRKEYDEAVKKGDSLCVAELEKILLECGAPGSISEFVARRIEDFNRIITSPKLIMTYMKKNYVNSYRYKELIQHYKSYKKRINWYELLHPVSVDVKLLPEYDEEPLQGYYSFNRYTGLLDVTDIVSANLGDIVSRAEAHVHFYEEYINAKLYAYLARISGTNGWNFGGLEATEAIKICFKNGKEMIVYNDENGELFFEDWDKLAGFKQIWLSCWQKALTEEQADTLAFFRVYIEHEYRIAGLDVYYKVDGDKLEIGVAHKLIPEKMEKFKTLVAEPASFAAYMKNYVSYTWDLTPRVKDNVHWEDVLFPVSADIRVFDNKDELMQQGYRQFDYYMCALDITDIAVGRFGNIVSKAEFLAQDLYGGNDYIDAKLGVYFARIPDSECLFYGGDMGMPGIKIYFANGKAMYIDGYSVGDLLWCGQN